MSIERQRFHLHCCALDRECRSDLAGFGGAPWRLEINTPWWHLGIALRPDSKYRFDTAWYSFSRWTP